MGQAKNRGTREERVQQAVEAKKAETLRRAIAEEERKRAERERLDEENRQREAAGLPPKSNRKRHSPLTTMLTMAAAASVAMFSDPRR